MKENIVNVIFILISKWLISCKCVPSSIIIMWCREQQRAVLVKELPKTATYQRQTIKNNYIYVTG